MTDKPWSVIDDAELERLRTRDRALQMILDDMEQALAAHDPEHPQHRSHGGQHTNGRCCPFGNVNPYTLGVFRRWVRDIR